MYREHSDLSLLTSSNFSGVGVYREHSDLSLLTSSNFSGVGCVKVAFRSFPAHFIKFFRFQCV